MIKLIINTINNKFNLNLQEHPYFLVTPSIIPTLTSISALFFVTEIVNFFTFFNNKIKNFKFFIFNKLVAPVYYFNVEFWQSFWIVLYTVNIIRGVFSGDYSPGGAYYPDLGDFIRTERGPDDCILWIYENGWSSELLSTPESSFLHDDLNGFENISLNWDIHSRFVHCYEMDREGFKVSWKRYMEPFPTKKVTPANLELFLTINPKFRSSFDHIWFNND